MASKVEREQSNQGERMANWERGGTPNFAKLGGLVPAIVQHADTRDILMLGYMNEEAFVATQKTRRVTFFSRTRQTLWQKGESSGNVLELVELLLDCDGDAILVKALPKGPTCHTGADSCFEVMNSGSFEVLARLSATLRERREQPSQKSYTSTLFGQGLDRVAQKVGEEAVEVVIEAKNTGTERLLDEAADLLFHLMALLTFRGLSLERVCKTLEAREGGYEREVSALASS